MKKADISKFDPTAAGDVNANIFGLNFDAEESNLILIPVPWEVTTSYGRGAAGGPEAIRGASPQLDLFDAELGEQGLPRPWEFGIHMEEIDSHVVKWNKHGCKLALPIIEAQNTGEKIKHLEKDISHINEYSEKLNNWLYERCKTLLEKGKIVGVVGGDHSVPYGSIKALSERYPGLGVLHIDAHADLRHRYLGFHYSHASIMENVMREIPQVGKLVQVGIRDFSDTEYDLSTSHPKIHTHFDYQLKRRVHAGESWASICTSIADMLPENVYISFDIDGLDPALCPHTGTPVPGGLQFMEVMTLFNTLLARKKKIVGFDLNEVAPGKSGDEWDGNVGARILYKLCGIALHSHGARSNETTTLANPVASLPVPMENSSTAGSENNKKASKKSSRKN